MRTISLLGAAIGCALALSPSIATGASPGEKNDGGTVPWLQLRAAFASEGLWPAMDRGVAPVVQTKLEASSTRLHGVKSKGNLDPRSLAAIGPASQPMAKTKTTREEN